MRILRSLISPIQVLSIIEGRCSTRLFLRSNSSQYTLSKPQRFAEKLMQEKYIGKHSLHIECSKDLASGRTSRFVNLTLVSWMRVAISYLQRNRHQLSVRVRNDGGLFISPHALHCQSINIFLLYSRRKQAKPLLHFS